VIGAADREQSSGLCVDIDPDEVVRSMRAEPYFENRRPEMYTELDRG
jgi:hypothetical protein